MKRTMEDKDKADDRPRRTFDPAPHNSVFEAEVVSIEDQETPWKDDLTGEPKMEVSFKFKVLDEGDFYDRWFWHKTPDWFSEKANCKLRQAVQAILDEDVLPAGFQLDTDDLIGLRARIIVHAKESKDGSRIVNWIEEVRPSKAMRRPTPPPPPANEEPF